MKGMLKIFAMLLAISAIFFVAGCAEKITTARTESNTQQISEQIRSSTESGNLAGNKSWTFAVMCDTRGDNNNKTPAKTCINDSAVKAIAAGIVNDGCDLVLVPGDMVNGCKSNSGTTYDKQFENWKNAMSPVYSAGIKVYTIRGNHEYTEFMNSSAPYDILPDPSLETAYLKAFGSDNPDNGPRGEQDLTYSFVHKNAFFIGLDEYARSHVHRVNQEWVNSQLANSTGSHLFVFGHEPAFKLYHKDCLEAYPAARDSLWNSIGKAGGHVYFCGHDHFYDRALIQDNYGNEIYQVIAGSGGAPTVEWNISEYNFSSRFKPEYHNTNDCGYVLVTVNGSEVKGEWKTLNYSGSPKWVTKDSFEL